MSSSDEDLDENTYSKKEKQKSSAVDNFETNHKSLKKPILLLDFDESGKVLLNKKAVEMISRIKTKVKIIRTLKILIIINNKLN